MWRVEYYAHDFTLKGEFAPINPVVVLKHKDVSSMTCEIALSEPLLTADLLGPKATNFILYRNDTQILEGEVTENDLAGERDTLLLEHKDWLFYLSERIYPFHYPFVFGDWPKKWTTKDLTLIVADFIQVIQDEDTDTPEFYFNNSLTGISTNYQIDAGDETTILDHIKTLAERDDGFDFRCRQPVGEAIRFNMFHPTNDTGAPVYTITRDVGQIDTESIEWKNSGPDATWTLGLGAGTNNKSRAVEDTYAPSRAAYYRRDKVVNFGEIRNYQMLQRLTAAEGYKQRFPQKSLNLPITVNTAELPNFWASSLGRPYSLLGQRIHVGPMLFRNYHTIDADFKILDMTIEPDSDGNDHVTFGLDMIDG
jgi:hypothetical protein